MLPRFFAAPAALFLLGGFTAAQVPAPNPGKQRLVDVATLGVTTRAPSKQERDKLSLKFEVRVRGQVVVSLVKDGPAARAGVAPGDVLVKLDANELYSRDDIVDFLSVSKPGQKVNAAVVRKATSKAERVPLTLGTKQVKASKNVRLEWQFSSLAQLDGALALAKKKKRLVLVGLSGAET